MLPQPQTFPCPNCNEIINESMQTCRFCSAPVDPQAASAAAEIQSRVNRATHLTISLHRSSGSVYLNLFGAAKVECNLRARSTAMLGGYQLSGKDKPL